MRLTACMLLLLLSLPPRTIAAAPLPPVVEAVRTALRANRIEDAVAAADQAVAALPQSAEAWHMAGGAYGRMAQSASIFSKLSWAKKCREAYLKAVERNPRLYNAQMDLLQYYLMAPGIAGGGREEAQAQVAAIGKLDAAWGHRAAAAIARADEDEAAYERAVKAAIAAGPTESLHRVDYAIALAGRERYDDAFAVLDEGLKQLPDDVRLHYHVGRLAALSGKQLQRGLAALEKAQAGAVKPEDFSEGGLVWRRAMINEKLGNKTQALPEYRRAIELEPSLKTLIEKDIERLQND